MGGLPAGSGRGDKTAVVGSVLWFLEGLFVSRRYSVAMGARLSVRSAAGPSRCEMPCAWPLRRPRYVDASAAGGEQYGRWIARRWKPRCYDPGLGAGQPPPDGRTNRRERRDPRSYPYAPRGLRDNPDVVVEQNSNNSCSVILATRSA